MQVHPDTAGDVLSGVMGVYGEGGAAPNARSGAAVALAACAAHIRSQDVPRALDFLLGQALADPVDAVRSQMVDAGAVLGLIAAHCFKMMLPLVCTGIKIGRAFLQTM